MTSFVYHPMFPLGKDDTIFRKLISNTVDREMIFEPFFSRRRGGTGLGLTIVRRVVDDHGGEVSVGDGAGGGGTVRIKLPCAEKRDRAAD